ncbi:histidine-containing phosphotransfer protein 4-like isoform X1 [Macadamia integrifolia]|uniref:histidine-containing phosphotransfer protein 4-like isoform X1 n=1 Tax=Macadamia integrifolia TaxID=60698 RepID=UPI001C4EFECE|nr:histidine-containing phosphotransfer protein 4-like isoform X1 [Macadamia integrifolia]XP_042486474.1 histidine-containing phosphotransfer protein 4-like isoform X1 [Macadamia integrifolia]XP_042486476.1 histidine-containing phosphotransfer protein 4-like isoform X1 [Macadamia integrifolia]
MGHDHLRHQAALIRQALLDQGYLDEHFTQLEELNIIDPDFVVEDVVSMYYRESAQWITNIEEALEGGPIDFAKLDDNMTRFKGSSLSIGATKVKNKSKEFIKCCYERNEEGFEWQFLRSTLIKYGFDNAWVQRVMFCLENTQLSMLLNGSPLPFFRPSRGLR